MKREFIIKNANLLPDSFDIEKELEKKEIIAFFSEDYKIAFNDNDEVEDTICKINLVLSNINASIVLEEIESEHIYRKVLLLNNLDCANCAAKIERMAQKELDNEFITVDFATSRFIIETKSKEVYDNLIPKVQEIANHLENGVIVTDKEIVKEKDKGEEEEEEGINFKTFLVGTILFVLLVIAHYIVLPLIFDGYNIYDINQNVPYLKWPLIAISIASYILLGGDVLLSALKNIRYGRVFDEKFLMALATGVALGIGSYIEAIAVMVFYKIGEILQDKVVENSRKSISNLLDIKPNVARVVLNEKEIEIDPSELAVGDTIIVKSGERIPADGVVIEGEANLDTSALTGESKYYEAKKGTKVVSGSINLDGVLYITVKKKYSDSLVSKILNLVENANVQKAKTERFVTKFAKFYTPIVCALALLIGFYFLIIEKRTVHDSFYPAMIFLVVSCPCALVISVPLGYFGAIGAASRRGILIKGSNYLDELHNSGVICFDKTGTLTKGKFSVQNIDVFDNSLSREDVLRIAAHCEVVSNHPIAKSIVNEFGIEKVSVNDVETIEISKRGVIVVYENKTYYVGNVKFLNEKKIKADDKEDGLYIYVADENHIFGRIGLVDEIREESKETVAELKKMGYEVVMLTGDNESIASSVAIELEIDRHYSGLTPVDKVRILRKLRKEFKNRKIIFVGDGINDAPVLTNADIGISMGKLGTDAAIEVSDVVLMNDDLSKLIDLLKIAHKTRKVVVQNIEFALAVKIIVLALAAIDKTGFVRMWEGVFADVGVSLIAVINSLRVASIDRKGIFKRLNPFRNIKRG